MSSFCSIFAAELCFFIKMQDHLAYCGAVVPELIFPMLVTKATAAFLAVLLAVLWTRKAGVSQQDVLEHEKDRKDDEKAVDPVPAPAEQIDDRP